MLKILEPRFFKTKWSRKWDDRLRGSYKKYKVIVVITGDIPAIIQDTDKNFRDHDTTHCSKESVFTFSRD
jgi:hypothetical protein